MLLSAVLLAACGGTDDSSSSSVETGPLRISGGGSGQFRERGRNNLIEEYGHEGTRPEMEQAAREVHEYLVALIEKDWPAACSHLSKYAREQVKREISALKRPGGKSCAGSIRAYRPAFTLPGNTPYASTEVDAGSLRVEGNFSYLFFNADTNGHKLIMKREDGVWKAYGLYPTSLH